MAKTVLAFVMLGLGFSNHWVWLLLCAYVVGLLVLSVIRDDENEAALAAFEKRRTTSSPPAQSKPGPAKSVDLNKPAVPPQRDR